MTKEDNGETKPLRWTDEQIKRRRQRSVALAWVLGGLVLLFFLVTVAKLGGNVAKRPAFGSVAVIEHVG
jgi:hypothetical protein